MLVTLGETAAIEIAGGQGCELEIRTAAGFTPKGTYVLLKAPKIIGRFERLRYNGKDQIPYRTEYTETEIRIVF